MLMLIPCVEISPQAKDYEVAMKSLPSNILSYSNTGYPEFDLMLIGVGTDGHVGLYRRPPQQPPQRPFYQLLHALRHWMH